MDLSIIVPLCNERENLPSLLKELSDLFQREKMAMELLFVDDGSTDGTFQAVLEEIEKWELPPVILLRLRRNFGKGPALLAGLERAKGQLIFTIDGDGQDNPLLLDQFISKIQDGFDMVVGWRKARKDPLGKILASRIYNRLISLSTGFPFRDINSGMRLFRADCLDEIDFYGHQYRLLPALFHSRGFRICQLEVDHRPRLKGVTKYGKGRFITGLLDIWTVLFLLRFRYRPAHFFSPMGLGLLSGGLAINGYIAYLRLAYGTIGFRYPLLILGVMMVVVGLQFIFTGLMAELMVLYFHKSQKPYSLAEVCREKEGDSEEKSAE